MPRTMTLELTILALKGLPDQQMNPVRMRYVGQLVFPGLGSMADPLREAGFNVAYPQEGRDELVIRFTG